MQWFSILCYIICVVLITITPLPVAALAQDHMILIVAVLLAGVAKMRALLCPLLLVVMGYI